MARFEIDSILELKKRRGEKDRTYRAAAELGKLGEIWEAKGAEAAGFADFVPMRIVTIIEVFVREVIRELVDYGSPYVERAERLTKNVKIEFDFLLGLVGRKLSVGDLVAHSVSISDQTRILSCLGILIPDFDQKLRTSYPRWIEEKASWPLDPLIQDYEQTIKQLSRLFTVRHILTHELPEEAAFDHAEIKHFLLAASGFIVATEWVLVELLRGDAALTQKEITKKAGDEIAVLEAEMRDLLAKIVSRNDSETDMLVRSQEAWQEFVEAEAAYRASLVAGGSIEPVIRAGAKKAEIRHRIKTLRWWAERGEGDL